MSELQLEDCDLSSDCLPSKWSVLEYFASVLQKKKEIVGYDPAISDVAEEVVCKLEQKWAAKGFPTISHQRIKCKVEAIYREYRLLVRANQMKRKSSKVPGRISKFKAETQKFFDIAVCKCQRECMCINPLSRKQHFYLQDIRKPGCYEVEEDKDANTDELDAAISDVDPAYIPAGKEDEDPDRTERVPRKSLNYFAMACDR